MFRTMFLLLLILWAGKLFAVPSDCESCHKKVTPGIVRDFNRGRMADGLTCADCHGDSHRSAEDAAKAQLPRMNTCRQCHGEQVDRFGLSSHNRALTDLSATVNPHFAAPGQDFSDCAACHLQANSQSKSFGDHRFVCLTCHSRHAFSAAEAGQPETCQNCHDSGRHNVWEVWLSSPHGKLFLKDRYLNKELQRRAPDCKTCHLPEADHRVRALRGNWFLVKDTGDKSWNEDQGLIRQLLGFAAADGRYTAAGKVLASLRALDVPEKAFKLGGALTDRACNRCHSKTFLSRAQVKRDDGLRQADRLLADFVRRLMQRKNLKQAPQILNRNADLQTRQVRALFFDYRQPIYRAALHANFDLMRRLLDGMKTKIVALEEHQPE